MENLRYIKNPIEHNERVTYMNNYFDNLSPYIGDNHKGYNFVLCSGGDGTLLKNIYDIGKTSDVMVGVNAGTVGYLMNDFNDVKDWIKNEKDIKIRTFRKIKANVYRRVHDELVEEEYQAFNEVMIGSSGNMNSWVNFLVKDKHDIIGDFNANGVIISTAQGSTGINKSNNGVILPLDSNMWSITGDKPSERKINYVIKPRKTIFRFKSRHNIIVWIDGSQSIIEDVERVELSVGDKIKVGFIDDYNFVKKRRL